jgi:hypothetical protein
MTMAGNALTTASTLQCPHGGQVQISSSNPAVSADGSPAVTSADTFTISGCPFQIPATPPIPSPCVRVQWIVPDVQATIGGSPTLSQGSSGLCLAATGVPQGPVAVANTQAAVMTR